MGDYQLEKEVQRRTQGKKIDPTRPRCSFTKIQKAASSSRHTRIEICFQIRNDSIDAAHHLGYYATTGSDNYVHESLLISLERLRGPRLKMPSDVGTYD